MPNRFRRLTTVVSAGVMVGSVVTGVGLPGASAAPAGIQRSAFATHYLGYGSHPYPVMPFGADRVWDTGVTWADMQPQPTSLLNGNNPVVQRMDGLVSALKKHGAQPQIVLGMTPYWAADNCNHGSWPVTTCGALLTGTASPWANYVKFLVDRYAWAHPVFETWNEPNLRNGWNDSPQKLADMQATAYSIIHAAGCQLVSPTIAITSGSPPSWLSRFLGSSGGKDFDIFGLHMYPSDKAARRGYGPEWSSDYYNRYIKPVLRRYGVRKPVFDTETNVGRHIVGISFSGMTAAGLVTRTYALQLASGFARVYWYGADERAWSGVWMEQSNYRSLTSAGIAETAAYRLLIGARPYGCTHNAHGLIRYTCRFRLASGKSALVEWTTGRSTSIRAPRGTTGIYNTLGGYRRNHAGARVRVTPVPQYIVGTFPV